MTLQTPLRPSAPPAPTAAGPGRVAPPARPARSRRLLRGGADDAAWVRPALLGLLAATALLYLWGLGASGWANSFYSAAAQAGSASWKAFFFGSSDAASSITVDKTPLALWPMALAIRVFGLSSWAILVPQALEGVAAVGLLYATVRRSTRSPGAGLLAGAVLALTPVATLMFRFNNPDALLVLLLIGSVYATLRALESDRALRWLALGGALVGLAFLTKMLQAFLVLPALALVYLVCARTSFGRRIGHLLVAFVSMVVAGGWWVAIVSLWPADSRPYIGGSQDNSILELTLGYNGFGRITGSETGSVGGGQGGGWGSTGLTRLLGSEIGGQIAWLLPASLILLGAGLWFARRAPRTDLLRAGLVVWGGWLLVTGLTFSFMAGIFHPYYTVALAPAIAALVATGSLVLWRARRSYAAALTTAVTVAFTSAFGFVLLQRTADYLPWLKWVVIVLGLASALLLAGVRHLPHQAATLVAGTALVAALAAPAAYSLDTASTPHTGSIPSAGPSSGQSFGGGFGGGPGGTRGFGGTQGSSAGNLLTGSTSSAAVTALLQTDADAYTWAAAAVGSNSAAGFQLASQEPVMAIGGFNGSDPSPTLAQFRQYVADGEIHYFIASGSGFGGGGGPSASGSSSSAITAWVKAHFTAKTVDGVTVYDLSGGRPVTAAQLARSSSGGLAVPADDPAQVPTIDIVIPVYNEEADLATAVERLVAHLASLPYTARITVADNASTDATPLVAARLARRFPQVRVVRLDEKGRGRALRTVWSASPSPVLVYMDVDLSTDLNALLPLVAPLLSGHSDLAIGSRLSRGSRTVRGPKRELISRSYNVLLRRTLSVRFRDAQCGFKAIRSDAARELLPLVQDNTWFFDTELLVLAERAGLRIHEVPVDWTDDPDSRVDVLQTALDDLRGIARLSWSLMRGRVPLAAVTDRLGRTSQAGGSGWLPAQVVLFVLVGVASTVAYAVLFLTLRQAMSAQLANALALLVTAVANTAANRRFTFGVRGRMDAGRHQVQGLLIFGAGLAVTSGALWLLQRWDDGGHHALEVVVLTAANLAVTVMRFVLMRWWVFRPRGDGAKSV